MYKVYETAEFRPLEGEEGAGEIKPLIGLYPRIFLQSGLASRRCVMRRPIVIPNALTPNGFQLLCPARPGTDFYYFYRADPRRLFDVRVRRSIRQTN